MTVQLILKEKGGAVISVNADDSLMSAARTLAERRIGAVLVAGADGGVAGVLSERDIVRVMASEGRRALDNPIDGYMTRDVITCAPGDTINDVMGKMTGGRFRHLPVLEDGKLAGMISIGDVVKHKIAETELEAEALKEYIATG